MSYTKQQLIEKYGPEKAQEYLDKNKERARKHYYENKEHHKEVNKKWRDSHPGCRAEEYRRAKERNPNLSKDRYWEDPEKNRLSSKQSYEKNKDKRLEYSKKWAMENPEKRKEIQKRYAESHKGQINGRYRTKKTRARLLSLAYARADLKYNRGISSITPEWIIDNVFSGQKCFYCDCDDWLSLGLDRIDNNKPHTPDNVVVCCRKCNEHRARRDFNEYLRIIGIYAEKEIRK